MKFQEKMFAKRLTNKPLKGFEKKKRSFLILIIELLILSPVPKISEIIKIFQNGINSVLKDFVKNFHA